MIDVRLSAVTCTLVAALCQVPFANAQTSGAAALTLDEAIALAKANNRNLKQYGLDIGKQREALGEARTHLYPRFDTSVLATGLLARRCRSEDTSESLPLLMLHAACLCPVHTASGFDYWPWPARSPRRA